MKGVSPIIDELVLVGVVVTMISSVFYFFQDSLASTEEVIEEQREKDYCDMSSNFIIEKVNGTEVTIWNNGGSKLNLEQFSAYINNIPVSINLSAHTILDLNNRTIIILISNPSEGDKVRIIGGCDTGDEFLVS